MKLSLSLCGFFVLLVCVTNTQAKGLAAVKKKSYHANSSARIFLFEEITILPRMIRFQIKGQPSYEVQRLKEPIAEWVEIMPKFLKTIDNDTQISRYKKSYNECVVFTEKYPPTKELLAPYMKILNDDIKKYDNGFVKHEDKWSSKAAFEKYKKKQQKAEELQEENPQITIKVKGLAHKVIDGRIKNYKGVIVTDFTPDKIRFRHGSGAGASSLHFEEIPEEVKRYLGLTEEKATAYRREIAEQNREKAHADRRASLLKAGRKLFFATVFQVTAKGVLLKDITYTDGKKYEEEVKVANKRRVSGPTSLSPNKRVRYKTSYTSKWVENIRIERMDDWPVFVECVTGALVDGGKFEEVVYPDGTYSYTNVSGALKTIPAYTTNQMKYLRARGFQPYAPDKSSVTELDQKGSELEKASPVTGKDVKPIEAQTGGGNDPFNGFALPDTKSLIVKSATYGAETTHKDVTDIVKSKIKDETLHFSANSYELGGDPIFGKVKQFRISYELRGQVHERVYREGEQVRIP